MSDEEGAPSEAHGDGVTLVTGATGLVGNAVVAQLCKRGRRVRAMVRNVERARAVVPETVELVEGDLVDKEAVERAMKGVSVVYHAAGLPEQWVPDVEVFERVNTEGTRSIAEAALAEGVEKFLYTSTIDVFKGIAGEQYNEDVLDEEDKHTPYERSKQKADRVVVQLMEQGLPAIFLHPSAVYGPAPFLSAGSSNALLADLVKGDIPMLLDGTMPFVYVDDVAAGHLKAEDSAEVGDRFILSESHHTLADVAGVVQRVRGGTKVPSVLPRWVAHTVSWFGEGFAKISNTPPLIPAGQLTFLEWGAIPCADRAREQLGWEAVPFEEGVRRTLAWLEEIGEVPAAPS